MKEVQCSVLVNFVLLNALLVNAQTNDEPTSVELRKFGTELSGESQKFFNKQDADGKKRIYKWKMDRDTAIASRDKAIQERDMAERERGYHLFTCAVEHIKHNMEMVNIQYKGEFKIDYNTGKRYNENRNQYIINLKVKLPHELIITERDFANLETTLVLNGKTIDRKNMAFRKIPYYYNEMYALLTRFDDDYYKRFLRQESIGNAEAIVKKIFKPEFDVNQKRQAIVDFASRYARIRHGANLFLHQYRSLISNKTVEIMRQKNPSMVDLKAIKTTHDITLSRVLDEFGFLKAWNITDTDLIIMNYVSETVRPLNDRIYLPFHYDDLDREGNQLKGVLPFAAENVCPITLRASTAVR